MVDSAQRKNGRAGPDTGRESAIPQTGDLSFLLVPSYMLGPETWRGVDEVLRLLGHQSAIACPTMTTPRDLDHLGPWVDQVVEAVPAGSNPVVLAAHAASCARMALVAQRLGEQQRPVQAIIYVNGRFPWTDGHSAVDADPPLRSMLDGLVRPDDYLPPWHRWWGSMIEDTIPRSELRNRVFAEARPTPRAVFDQGIPVPELPASVDRCFLATGPSHSPDYERAKDAGWTVARLDGEHLHIVVDPLTSTGMMLSLVRRAADRRTNPAPSD